MNNPRIADSFPARVRFLTPEEGGRRRPLGNPGWSQLAVPPIQTSCLVVAVDQEDEPLAADTVIPLGEDIAARVVVWGANYCARELGSLGPDIEFFEGSRHVGSGRMLAAGHLEPTPDDITAFLNETLAAPRRSSRTVRRTDEIE